MPFQDVRPRKPTNVPWKFARTQKERRMSSNLYLSFRGHVSLRSTLRFAFLFSHELNTQRYALGYKKLLILVASEAPNGCLGDFLGDEILHTYIFIYRYIQLYGDYFINHKFLRIPSFFKTRITHGAIIFRFKWRSPCAFCDDSQSAPFASKRFLLLVVFHQPIWKNMLIKLDHFPTNSGWKFQKYSKPTPIGLSYKLT